MYSNVSLCIHINISLIAILIRVKIKVSLLFGICLYEKYYVKLQRLMFILNEND